jgi:hypothetical protein
MTDTQQRTATAKPTAPIFKLCGTPPICPERDDAPAARTPCGGPLTCSDSDAASRLW